MAGLFLYTCVSASARQSRAQGRAMSDTRIDNPTLADLAELTEAAIQAAGRGDEAVLLAWLDSGGRIRLAG